MSDGVYGRTFDQALDPLLGEDAARLLGRVFLLLEPLPEGGEQALFAEAAAGEGGVCRRPFQARPRRFRPQPQLRDCR